MKQWRIMGFCIALVSCVGSPEARDSFARFPDPQQSPPAILKTIDVMTYNVKGLPFPLARNRPSALAKIGAQLSAMRQSGAHPQIVVLQEAFIAEARAIGRAAGYRHIALGPEAPEALKLARAPISADFAAAADWTRGETSGAVLSSGLMILSDFPIIRTRRLAFPQGACAGFDCLAAKGMVIAWIALPGHDQPLAVATAHLNANKASGVPLPRADRAFAWQWSALRGFVREQIGAQTAMIFAGDFNIGGNAGRLAIADRAGPPLPAGSDALAMVVALGAYAPEHEAEAQSTAEERTDSQFYRSGAALQLAPLSLAMPFPERGESAPLSDHPGFTIRYRLERVNQRPTP